jgi:acetyl-CoA carboxylase carboxyltransferase component
MGRIAALCDPGTVRALRGPADGGEVGVVAARGRVDGRPVVCYAMDSTIKGGSVGTAEADVVVRAMQLARTAGAPLVAFLESAGARLQEGAAALGGFGRIFFQNVALHGIVPQVSVITGTSAGGGCYSPALTDFIVMTRSAAMFLTGPQVVKEAVGEEVGAQALGGPGVHDRNGVCHFIADDDHAAVDVVRDLLSHLTGEPGAPAGDEPVAVGPGVDPGRHVPALARQTYDVRDVVRDVVDGGRLLEVAPRWARNMVTGFARLGGRAVGVVGNQPRFLGGVIDVAASEKGARFVNACQRFGVPLLVFVDTPGFMPGSGQETLGIIRHGAQLVHAFAAATVPRFTIVLRKAYGGAYITMNSKDLGAGLVLAWPGAEIGIMGPHAAVGILHRRRLRDASRPDLADQLADEYRREHIAAERAYALGLVDAVVAPQETRGRLTAALAA